MKRPAPIVGVAALLALAAAHPRAQRGDPGRQPVFRSATQLVLVDVIVTDSRDRVVTDLTRDDFTVTEGGRPQRIDQFSFESIPPADRPVDLDAPARPPADVASNAQRSERSRAFVFAIDETMIPPSELVPLKRLMTAVLQTVTPNDQVAVVYLGRSDLGTDFTNDVDRLIEVVNNGRAAVGSLNMGGIRGRMITLRNIVRTLQASRDARRAVFLVGSGGCVPHLPQDDWGECRDLVKQAREADVPFYVLDPRLFPEGNLMTAVDSDTHAQAVADESARRDEMLTLAGATGGRAVSRAADPAKAAADVIVENGTFYLLGFYPDPLVSDGKFHEIHVGVKRPGLRVRARMGYRAPTAATRASTPTRDLTATLGAGIDDPGLPIRVFAAPVGPAPNGRTRTLVTMEVSYPRSTPDLSLDDDLRIGILAITPDAKIKASFQRPVHLAGKWRPTDSATIFVNETIDLPSDRLSLRVGVTSRALGRSGTAHLYVDPPDFGGKRLAVGGILLGAPEDTPRATAGLESLRGIAPFQPTTRRTFAADGILRLFARAFWKAGSGDASATISLVGGEGRPPRTIALGGRPGAGGLREATLDTSVPLAGLRPGAYVLRVEFTLPGGDPVVRAVPFEVAR